MRFENVLVVDPIDGEFVGRVKIEGNVISEVERITGTMEYEGIIMPGFVDPHTHGSVGVDALSMNEKGSQEVGRVSLFARSDLLPSNHDVLDSFGCPFRSQNG